MEEPENYWRANVRGSGEDGQGLPRDIDLNGFT
jgi:hypothetical protein